MSRGPSLEERLNRRTLEKLYNDDRLSSVQIGARYGARSPQVLNLLDEYRIPRGSRGSGKT